MESEGKAAGGRVTCSCGGGYDWVGCDFFCVPLFYVTRLLTATMRSHAIACDISKKNLSFRTVRVLENASGTRSGTESLPKVFLQDNFEQISFIIFFAFLKKEEMRSGTHFTQQNVFLLFTVVVTKHVWPYFQSRFPKTSSERVSSRYILQTYHKI